MPCTGGSLLAALVSAHQETVVTPDPPAVKTKAKSRHCYLLPWGQNETRWDRVFTREPSLPENHCRVIGRKQSVSGWLWAWLAERGGWRREAMQEATAVIQAGDRTAGRRRSLLNSSQICWPLSTRTRPVAPVPSLSLLLTLLTWLVFSLSSFRHPPRGCQRELSGEIGHIQGGVAVDRRELSSKQNRTCSSSA